MIPNQRPKAPPRQIETAARSSSAPNAIAIQPQVFRSLRMNVALATKNFEFETAAIPQMTLRLAAIANMVVANRIQPTPS